MRSRRITHLSFCRFFFFLLQNSGPDISNLEGFFFLFYYFFLKFYDKLSVSVLREKRPARQINQYEANGSKLNILKENYMANERRRGEKEAGKKNNMA